MNAVSFVVLAIVEGVTATLVEGGEGYAMVEDALIVGGSSVAAPMPRNGAQPTRWASNHNWNYRGDNTKYKAKK